MKLRKGWKITTVQGDAITVFGAEAKGTLRWANRHGYRVERVVVMAQGPRFMCGD